MNTEPEQEFTSVEELANIPLSDLVEPEWLELPEIEPQDLELPSEYLEDLMQREVISEDMLTIDMDTSLLEGLGPEKSPIMKEDEPVQELDTDFGR